MFGIVNKAVRQMVIERHGEDVWRRIRDVGGVSFDHFEVLDSYPDEVTLNLVSAACEVLGVDRTALLKLFGEYWIQFVWDSEYRHLIHATGRSFPDFVANLDQLHVRLVATFRAYAPPSFRLVAREESQITLHYSSQREGWLPFVGGILEGVGRRFGLRVSVEFLPRPQGADHDVLRLRWAPMEAGHASG
jgi:hypothetical protein